MDGPKWPRPPLRWVGLGASLVGGVTFPEDRVLFDGGLAENRFGVARSGVVDWQGSRFGSRRRRSIWWGARILAGCRLEAVGQLRFFGRLRVLAKLAKLATFGIWAAAGGFRWAALVIEEGDAVLCLWGEGSGAIGLW
jgi:hypothetical protein